jgi:hypothetical protein
MLVASILIVYALEEANTRFPWKSVAIILPLAISVIAWFGFVGWEIRLGKKMKAVEGGECGEGGKEVAEPIFPMRLLKSRVLCGMLLFVLLPLLNFSPFHSSGENFLRL